MSLLLLFVLAYTCVFTSGELRCIEKERDALLRFKQGLIDESGIIRSWGSEEDKKECCLWKGIKCSNETGHVISLQLGREFGSTRLSGKISIALIELKYLNHLDLSYNDFGYNHIPQFIGSFEKLQHLNLGWSSLSGIVPHQLGNLTNLRTLDLGGNDLSFENYTEHTNSLQSILTIPSLRELNLSQCQVPTYFLLNSSSDSLSVLDLSWSRLNSSSFHWLFNITANLRSIYLSGNNLDVIPDEFRRFSSLEHLDLSYNQLTGGLPKSLGNLSYLKTLELSENSLSGEILELFNKLSEGVKESLAILKLDNNKLYGPLPDFTMFSSLRILHLQGNQLNGSFPDNLRHVSRIESLDLSANQISGSMQGLRALNLSLKELYLSGNKLKLLPTGLWELSMLERLDVSFNSIEGTISDTHLSKLGDLKVLDLSFNSLILNFSVDWIPPFQLNVIKLASCKMGHGFPPWLRSQTSFSILDLSCAGISEEMPKWFWDLSQRISYLNLSHNQISGSIPDLSSNFFYLPKIDISYNNFSGQVQSFHPKSEVLLLSDNMFVGSISSICTVNSGSLHVLDLSNNQFSGKVPDCFENMTMLQILNFANNKLSGNIPHTLGFLKSLQILHLRGNNFSGELPSSLKSCQDLLMVDVGGNELTGTIPAWIGTQLTLLRVVNLGQNNFRGSIPVEICYLTYIQILDLSRNFISGRIPQCFKNFLSLVEKDSTFDSFLFKYSYDFAGFIDHAFVHWKGQEVEYRKTTVGLVKLIDLSSNRLAGNVPREFSQLRALISLNLSRNYLSGNIISDIGHMEMLESLDLSRNKFSGEIPNGLAKLNLLAFLNLSYNHLSGKIPSSTQLQSFNPSAYVGNSGLCGSPLTSCPGDDPNPPTTRHGKGENIADDKDDDDFIARLLSHEFYITIILGFIVGFWGAVGTLVLKSSWRNAYFNFFSRIGDWLYVTTTIYAGRLKRSLRNNVNDLIKQELSP